MRIVVISCWKYRDAWKPFFALMDKFWPDCPHHKWLVIDRLIQNYDFLPEEPAFVGSPQDSWCQLVSQCAARFDDEPILLMQEDFFMTAQVNEEFINHALALMEAWDGVCGCIRLFPAIDWETKPEPLDRYFDIVPVGTRYRISCQAAIWKPSYLKVIADHAMHDAMHFELDGSTFADTLPEFVLSANPREKPWPVDYLCSAITRGQWSQGAKRLCDENNIEVDWSLRPLQAV